MEEKKNMRCPYCDGQDIVEAYMQGDVWVVVPHKMNSMQLLYCAVCRNCGTVVRSYVKNPEKLK